MEPTAEDVDLGWRCEALEERNGGDGKKGGKRRWKVRERRFTLRFWERRALSLTAKGVNDVHIDFRMLAGLLVSSILWTKANGERTASLSKLAASL